MTRGRLPLVLLLALLCSAALRAAPEIPYLTGRVVDGAGIISADELQRLTAMLKAHEAATTNQIVVLTEPTIAPDSIEEYAVKVFETWKLGQKGKDNGVLVVVVPRDRKMRIEVGYGLEATLPDGAAGEIIRTWMTPAFKAGNYDKGIEDGVAAVIARLEGRGGPIDRTPAAAPAATGGGGFEQLPMPKRLVLGVFVFGIIGLFTAVGIMTPGFGWFLYVFLIPFWAMLSMAILGPRPAMALLGAYLIGYPIAKLRAKRTQWYQQAARDMKRKGKGSRSVYSSGGASWSSGGSSSSSSFSGGGGSSGGGGASGSW